jgi:hypothetical protein
MGYLGNGIEIGLQHHIEIGDTGAKVSIILARILCISIKPGIQNFPEVE